MLIMTDFGIVLISIAVLTSLAMGLKVYAHRLEIKEEKPKIESIKQSIKEKNIDDIPEWKICKLQSVADHIKDKLKCKNHITV